MKDREPNCFLGMMVDAQLSSISYLAKTFTFFEILKKLLRIGDPSEMVNFFYVNRPRLKLISSGVGGGLEMHDNTGLERHIFFKL